jgi:hypothetical protein
MTDGNGSATNRFAQTADGLSQPTLSRSAHYSLDRFRCFCHQRWLNFYDHRCSRLVRCGGAWCEFRNTKQSELQFRPQLSRGASEVKVVRT